MMDVLYDIVQDADLAFSTAAQLWLQTSDTVLKQEQILCRSSVYASLQCLRIQ